MTIQPASPPLAAEVRKAYDAYMDTYHGDLSDSTHFAETMFHAGGRTAIEAMVVFGDIVPQLHRVEAKVKRLLELLEAFS